MEPVPGNDQLTRLEVTGLTRIINVGLLEDDPAGPGDWVLLHVGYAMGTRAGKAGWVETVEARRAICESEEVQDRIAAGWGITRDLLARGSELLAGAPPPAGHPEDVAWWEGTDPEVAARSGDVVASYRLLWELTHVVFEHPGLLAPEPASDGPACVTCADQATVAEASRRGRLTVGLAGYDGGAMAASETVEHCLVVASQSVHRIQEARDALVWRLWSVVQEHLGEERPR